MSTRKLIRQNIVDRLKAAITELDGKVYSARAGELDDNELPCICVYTREEPVETLDPNPAIQTRTLSLAVEICVVGSADIDDQIDDFAERVEAELLGSDKQRDANGLYHSAALARTDVGFVERGRKPMGAGRLTFEFSYEKIFT